MIDAHRRRVDKFDRERVFITDNAADFPVGSTAHNISLELDTKVDLFLGQDADLVSSLGDKTQAMEIKGDARDNLLDAFREIILGAKAISDVVVPGITMKYKMPYPRTEQNLIASADAWFADLAPLEAQFVEVGLSATFRDDLIDAKEAFQQARDEADSALEEHGEAVGAMEAQMRELMALSRRRSALVKLMYKNNPGKLAAWEIASHLEQPPKAKAPTPPN